MAIESTDYYAVLEVTPGATQESIYSAYQNAQATYSLKNPEILKIFSQDEALAWIELIEEAYAVIGSPNSRRQYDLESQGTFQTALPSFDLSNKTDHIRTPAIEEQELPAGFAKTKISQYQVVAAMEEAIAKQELFDGLFLKKVREYKNVDLKEFSKITCIAIRHLYAIENNNFSVLPAGVFVRGYIIQYCRHLDLDEKLVAPSFMALFANDN